MAKTETTERLEDLLDTYLKNKNDIVASVFECEIGWNGNEIVDCISYSYGGTFTCYEIKQTKSDFHSGAALTFIGHKNFFVMTYELYEEVKEEIPREVGVMVAVDHVDVTNEGRRFLPGDKSLFVIKRCKQRTWTIDPTILLGSMLRSIQNDSTRRSRSDGCQADTDMIYNGEIIKRPPEQLDFDSWLSCAYGEELKKTTISEGVEQLAKSVGNLSDEEQKREERLVRAREQYEDCGYEIKVLRNILRSVELTQWERDLMLGQLSALEAFSSSTSRLIGLEEKLKQLNKEENAKNRK